MSDEDDLRMLRRLSKVLPDNPVIFDIGGSDGTWALSAFQVWPQAQLHLFEPLLETGRYAADFKHLKERELDLKAHVVAIGDHDGEADFFVTPDAVSSTALNWPAGDALATRRPVCMCRLDSMMADGRLPTPDLIKLDIQGGEMKALAGGQRALEAARALVIEAWLTKGYGPETPLLPDLILFLRSFGFRLSDLATPFRHETGEAYAVDTVFIKADCAFLPPADAARLRSEAVQGGRMSRLVVALRARAFAALVILITMTVAFRYISFVSDVFVPVYYVDDWTNATLMTALEKEGLSLDLINSGYNAHRMGALKAIFLSDIFVRAAGWLSFFAILAAAIFSALCLAVLADRAGLTKSQTIMVAALAALAGTAPHLGETLVWGFGLPTLLAPAGVFAAGLCLVLARERDSAGWIAAAVICVFVASQAIASGIIGGIILLLAMPAMGFGRRPILQFAAGLVLVLAAFYAPFPAVLPRGTYGPLPATFGERLENFVSTLLSSLGSPLLPVDGFTFPLRATLAGGAILLVVMTAWGCALIPRLLGRRLNPSFVVLFALMAFTVATPAALAAASPEVNALWIAGGGRYAMSGLWFVTLSAILFAAALNARQRPKLSRALLTLVLIAACGLYVSAQRVMAHRLVTHANALREGASALLAGVADPASLFRLNPYSGPPEEFVKLLDWVRPTMQRFEISAFASEMGSLVGRPVTDFADAHGKCLTPLAVASVQRHPALAGVSSETKAAAFALRGELRGPADRSDTLIAVNQDGIVSGLGFASLRTDDFRLTGPRAASNPRAASIFFRGDPSTTRLFKLRVGARTLCEFDRPLS